LKAVVKERLGELITAEALYQEALRLKLDRKPEIQRKIRQILSQELLEEQVQRPLREKKFSEEELRRYFDEHIGEYSRPEQVRLADIFIAVPEGATAEERKAKREKAEEVLAKAFEAKDKRFGFAELVRKYSDKHPLFRLGDTGFFDREGKPSGLDPALVDAAFKLKQNRDLAESVVETKGGFHVIMQVGKRSAVNTEFKDVASAIERRLRREQMQKRRVDYIEGLKKTAGITVDETVVAGIAGELEKAKKGAPSPLHKRLPARGRPMSAPPRLPGEGQRR
jgi:parvulin-like peptidyl-prolyl isomerase